jgi:hypothetical protein
MLDQSAEEEVAEVDGTTTRPNYSDEKCEKELSTWELNPAHARTNDKAIYDKRVY